MKQILKICLFAIIAGMLFSMLVGCSGVKAGEWSGVSGITVPWGDYEEATYKTSANGKPTDDILYIVEKTQVEGKDAFKMQTPLLLKEGEFVTGAIVEADTLKPVSSFVTKHPPEKYKDKTLELTGQYKDKLYITAKAAAGNQDLVVNLSGECLDNESVVSAIRAFPLEEGYTKAFNLCILSTAKVAPFEIKVTGREKVQVPFGEVECYKVEMKVKGFLPSNPITLWYSADEKKQLVKYSQGTTLFELKSVKTSK